MSREIGDKWGISRSLSILGLVAYFNEDCATARVMLEESLAISQEIADRRGIAWSLYIWGLVAREQREHARARSLTEQGLAIQKELGDRRYIAYSLDALGALATDEGDYATARTLHQQALSIFLELGERFGIFATLWFIAAMLAAEGKFERSLRLFGAVMAMRQSAGASQAFPPLIETKTQQVLQAAQQALGEAACMAALAEGQAMSAQQAIAYALEDTVAGSTISVS